MKEVQIVYIIRTKRELNKFVSTHKLVDYYQRRLRFHTPEETFSVPTAFRMVENDIYTVYCAQHDDSVEEIKRLYIKNYGKDNIQFIDNLEIE